jgi:hypothetical protein
VKKKEAAGKRRVEKLQEKTRGKAENVGNCIHH